MNDTQQKEYENALRNLQFIPEEDHDKAKELFLEAVELGWTSIGFWESWSSNDDGMEPNPAELDDMFGVHPKSGFGVFINKESLAESREPYNGLTVHDMLKDL